MVWDIISGYMGCLIASFNRWIGVCRMPSVCQTISVEEAGRILGCSRNGAYEAVKRGEIPCIRIGKRLFVPKAALERMLYGMGTPTPAEAVRV
jgi:excisionase family DNA binding protein